jgi:endoglucanase
MNTNGARLLTRLAAACLALLPLSAAAAPMARCMNLGNALEAPHEGDWGYTIAEGDFATIRAAGFDSVRIPVAFSAHAAQSAPYTLDPAFMDRVDQVIGWSLNAGLVTVIDLHGYTVYAADPDGTIDRLDGIWAQVAARYRAAPPALMFELLNEPGAGVAPDRLARDTARLIATIRKTNPDRTIIWGANGKYDDRALTATTPPKDRHLIATFHYYDPFGFTSQDVPGLNAGPRRVGWGSKADHQVLHHDFRAVAAWAKRHKTRVFLGEFGVSLGQPTDARAAYIRAVRREAEAQGFAWCNWALYAHFDAWDGDRRFIPEILDALTGN